MHDSKLLTLMRLDDNIQEQLAQAQALLDSGRIKQAKAEYAKICRFAAPDNKNAWLGLGLACSRLGVNEEAITALRSAVQLRPECTRAWLALGKAQQAQGSIAAAERSFRKVVELESDNAEALSALGLLLAASGRVAECLAAYEKAVTLDPDNSELLFAFASACQKGADYSRAEGLFRRILQLQSGHPRAMAGLGFCAAARGDYTGAREYFRKALGKDDSCAEAHYGLGAILARTGDCARALTSLWEAIRLAPENMAAWMILINLLLTRGKPEEVLRACDDALRIQPGNPDILAISARILARMGKKAEGAERLRPIMELAAVNVNVGLACAALADYLHRQQEAVRCLENLLGGGKVATPATRRRVLFALGRLCDSLGSYDKAFGYYREANDMIIDPAMRESIVRRNRRNQARVDSLMRVHSAKLHAGWPRAGNRSQLPVFIVGMPRSGTTLIEQILASHPEVYGAGEINWLANLADAMPGRAACKAPYPHCIEVLSQRLLDEFSCEYLNRLEGRAAGCRRVTDKMPGNYLLLGLVDLLFPGARIVHCVRNPLDTCLSIYFQEFQKGETYSGELTDVGRIYLQYRRLMRHWQGLLSVPILEVNYQDLVTNQEAVSRKLVDFCDLSWDDRCLRFYENRRYVHTASYDQVNRPVYLDSLDRWKNYRAYLDPLCSILGSENGSW